MSLAKFLSNQRRQNLHPCHKQTSGEDVLKAVMHIGSLLIIHGTEVFSYILRTVLRVNMILGITRQFDQIFDLKLNVGYSDLYFMMQ